MQWKLLTVKMPVSQVAYSSDITKHNLCSHLIMMIFSFQSIAREIIFPEATGFCRGSKECLQRNMNEHFMPQTCVASKCDSDFEIFLIIYVRLSVVPVHYFLFHITVLAELSLTLWRAFQTWGIVIRAVSASAHALIFKANLTTEWCKALPRQ